VRPLARVGAVLALALGAALTACSGDEEPVVEVARVAIGDVTEVVEAAATVTPKATASLTAPADGSIAELFVQDGQQVSAGQVLLRINSPSAEEQLRQAEQADREAAESGQVSIPGADLSAQQHQADEAAERGFSEARTAAEQIPDPTVRTSALASVAAAEAQYDIARAQARTAVARFNAGLDSIATALSSLTQAQRVQTRAAVQVAQQTVDALLVSAPISGTVTLGGDSSAAGGTGATGEDLSSLVDSLPSSVQGQAGQLLGGTGGGATTTGALSVGVPIASGQQLATVTDVSTLSLSADVDETDILLVQPGVPADVELDAVPGASYAATVTTIDVTATPSSRGGVAYRVNLALQGGTLPDGNPAPAPRPGMSAVADLRVRDVQDVVAVPTSAIVRDGPRDAVWVVEDGTAQRRTVTLGAQGDDIAEVADGLRLGELVVVRGADQVSEGEQIE
jgi:HlyD family secretion protein